MKGDLQTFSRQLRRRTARGLASLRRQAAKSAGQQRVMVEPMPVLVALAHPDWGEAAAELLAYACASAFGEQRQQCFICCRPWTINRGVAVFMPITFVGTGRALGTGACHECAADLYAGLEAALHRDLGCKPGAFQIIADPGKA